MNHICPPDRPPHPYVLAITNSDRSSVIVQHNSDGKLCFPRLGCPEIPAYGRKVCECISQEFEEMCGTRYELLLLYSTINDFPNDHIRPIFSVSQCISPNKKGTEILVDPARKEYEWMAVKEVDEQMNWLGEEKCRWIDDTKDFETFVFLSREEQHDGEENEFHARPWELPGWFDVTTKAAIATLAKLGYEGISGFEQFSITHFSAVLRADTKKGRVYLKASNNVEGKVTRLASSLAPHLVGEPIFVNEEKNWMLMKDYGEPADNMTPEDYSRLLLMLGKLQVKSMQNLEALRDAGLRTESSRSLIQRAKVLLEDKSVREHLVKYEEFELDAEEGLPNISNHTAALFDLLRELYDSGKCPLSLTHADITGNVLRADDGSLVLFDWGAAEIDIPLCDTYCFKVSAMVMDQYLSLWEQYAPVSHLRRLLEIVPIQSTLSFVLQGYEASGRISESQDVARIAWLLVRAKEVAEEKTQ